LVVVPTGGGKTVVAGAVVRKAVDAGERVLFLAHRIELIQQAAAKLFEIGIDAGIIQAGFPMRLGEPVQVASVQTLYARAIRGSAIDLPAADIVIVDECHHCPAQTYAKILAAYPDSIVIGLTATPCRGDGRGLGNIFQTIIEGPQVAKLIEMGFLVPTRVYAPSIPDLTGVTVRQGDYAAGELEDRMDRPQLVGDVGTHWHRLAGNRPTVVFASGVRHSVHIRDELRRSGVLAEHIDGKTPKDERDAILKRLAADEIKIVTNAMVLTEGWDCPEVSCIVLARPTKHMGLYRQMLGRVLRPALGKSDALVIDHAGATIQHGFVEDDVVWTLRSDARATAPAHDTRQHYSGSRLTTCPKCSAIRTAGEGCRFCGWKPEPKPLSIDVRDGELGRLDRGSRLTPHHFSIEMRVRWHAELAWIARDRGYRSGWAAYKFKEKFGDWPPRETPAPCSPSPEVKSWVRSRQIAYAKAMQKADGAAA
jgi:superfamily II DNA or RNA helicase